MVFQSGKTDNEDTAQQVKALLKHAEFLLSDETFPPALRQELDVAAEMVCQAIEDPNSPWFRYAAGYLGVVLDKFVVDVDQINIPQIQKLVKQGTLTYEKLIKIYLRRIDFYNDFGVSINAIRVLNPYAKEEARKCDSMCAENKDLAKGLFGIPVLLKDNIDTDQKYCMPTTAGSIAFANNYVAQNAVLVQRLLEQGAIILGKTNLSEFANFITNGIADSEGNLIPMPSGYSSLGGQVLCPYKPGVINPAGSSSGSGAACAAAMAAVTVGTETSGSILNPANANSLVAVKPTVGLISRRGIIPLSHSQDTAGPMARNVTDVAILLEAMKSYDGDDIPVTAGSKNELVTETYWKDHTVYYPGCLDAGGLLGKRLGVYTLPDKTQDGDVYAAFCAIIELLKSLGAEIVFATGDKGMEAITLNGRNELPWVSELLHLDFASDLQRYLDGLAEHNISLTGTPILNLRDIVEYNKKFPEKLPYGQTILERCAEIDIRPDSEDMKRAKIIHDEEIAWSRTQTIDKLFDEYRLDALIALNGGTTRIAAKAGYPTVTIPAGYRDLSHDQYPINLQFTGQAFSEGQLLAMAYAFEKATHARIAPGMALKYDLKRFVAEAATRNVEAVDMNEVRDTYNSNFATPAQVYMAQKLVSGVCNPDKAIRHETSAERTCDTL